MVVFRYGQVTVRCVATDRNGGQLLANSRQRTPQCTGCHGGHLEQVFSENYDIDTKIE